MRIHFEKEISGDGAYFRSLFGLLIAWSRTIKCTRSFFWPGLTLRIMHNYCENEILSDGGDLHALFGLLLAWSNTIRCLRYEFCNYFILRRMHSHCEKKLSSDCAYFNPFF